MLFFYILIFVICCLILYFSGEWAVRGLVRIAGFLGWREFVVAFFIIALAGSLPNLFVGVTAAFQEIPELSFGDVVGNNLVLLTLGVGLAVLFTKGGEISVKKSRTIQTTAIFTILAVILPLLLILDGELSRIDGILLIALFLFFIFWLFSRQERFTRIYSEEETLSIIKGFKIFVKDSGKVISGIILLMLSAWGIIISAQFLAQSLNVPLILIGLLITGLGTALAEIYFSVASAMKGQIWMILGNLMGGVIIPPTLVLGIVALIQPIVITDSLPLVIAGFFLIIVVFLFFFFIRTGRKITKKEAFFLLGIYIVFVITEIFAKVLTK